ncbi:hypothetical protein [Novosphingobium huizhouense]|uniref:hypothetical protein n=1 Tax=Novosphingobium huizhouense TaxID=2866625 RepID=UPI001CD83268|nr:hypothetical protein [Novosphingobium huizhouense]
MTSLTAELTPVRKSILPKGGDTWESIAARELPDVAQSDAVGMLQSWNLHVFMRASGGVGRMRGDNPILPSDVIFVEAPHRD